jgi:hypothetical protein
VSGHKKHAKREAARKITERYYHVYDQETQFQHHKMSLESLGSGDHNGLIAHYNFRFDPDLPLNMVAVRRIPCACDGCLDQLTLPWDKTLDDPKLQARYSPVGARCKYHQMFGSLNDWKLKKLTRHKEGDPDELEETFAEVLLGVSERNAKEIKKNHCGAVNWNEGFYVIQWTGEPCTLQQDETWNDCTPPMLAKAGELVCKGRYLQRVPRARNWHTHAGPEEDTTVRLKHVVATDLLMMEEAPDNKLPTSCRRADARSLKPVRLPTQEYDDIQDEIHKRSAIDYEENFGDAQVETEEDVGQDEDAE